MTARTSPDKLRLTELADSQIALGRLGSARRRGGTPLVYLASDEAAGYVTGEVLNVSGGLYI